MCRADPEKTCTLLSCATCGSSFCEQSASLWRPAVLPAVFLLPCERANSSDDERALLWIEVSTDKQKTVNGGASHMSKTLKEIAGFYGHLWIAWLLFLWIPKGQTANICSWLCRGQTPVEKNPSCLEWPGCTLVLGLLMPWGLECSIRLLHCTVVFFPPALIQVKKCIVVRM